MNNIKKIYFAVRLELSPQLCLLICEYGEKEAISTPFFSVLFHQLSNHSRTLKPT